VETTGIQHTDSLYTPNFYDLSEPNNTTKQRVMRAMILCLDNAPYHHGVKCNLNDLSKESIAALLKEKFKGEIPVMKFTRKEKQDDGTTVLMNYEIDLNASSGEATAMKVGLPLKDELLEFAYKILKQHHPELVEPAWQSIVNEINAKGEWGREEGIPSIQVKFSFPYAASLDFIPIEFVWAVGKNFVANPDQQFVGRTSSDVIKMIRKRWSKMERDGTCNRLFLRSEKEMDEWIKKDSVLSGTVTNPRKPLKGYPMSFGKNSKPDLNVWTREIFGEEYEDGFEPGVDDDVHMDINDDNSGDDELEETSDDDGRQPKAIARAGGGGAKRA
jgi:hypothetical protein